jgi:DNA-directed RNA polymerase
MNNKESILFYIYIPIKLDASCNGYQHLVMLTKKVKLLNKLNLDKSTHYDHPNDFYSYLNEINYNYINNEVVRLQDKLNNSTINYENKKKCY